MIVRSEEAERRIAEYIRMNPWRCVQELGGGLRGIGNPALWSGEKLGVLCSRGRGAETRPAARGRCLFRRLAFAEGKGNPGLAAEKRAAGDCLPGVGD
jgi:hypothetical protein